MKKIMLAAVLGALFNTASSIAHEGHDHSFITEYAAVDVGREFASGLTQKEAGFGLGKLRAGVRFQRKTQSFSEMAMAFILLVSRMLKRIKRFMY